MDSDVGHLSPVGLLILAPLSHWSRLAEQNLNCRLNPKPPPMPEDSGTRRESQTVSQPSLRRPFPFQSSSLHLCTACGEGEWERCMGDGEQSTHAHTHIYTVYICEWKQEESVTHMAGLRVDYRTPEEIFLSPQTVSGGGLTTAEPQNKHVKRRTHREAQACTTKI